MAPKRAGTHSPSPSLRSTASPIPHPPRRAKTEQGILTSYRVHILQAKLTHKDVSELHDLAEKANADVVSSPDEAHVVITAIGMRKRLERHLDWNLAVSGHLPLPSSAHPDLAMTATEKKGAGNARLAAPLCRARAPPAMRGLRCSDRSERGGRGALSA